MSAAHRARYAGRATSVLGLDPNPAGVEQAQAALPARLRPCVTCQVDDMTASDLPPAAFDVAIVCWSLWCIRPEGVVAARHKIHVALRAGGLVLDMHREPEHAQREVSLGGNMVSAGRLDKSSRTATVLTVRNGLAEVTAAGAFLPERAVRFPLVWDFDSIDAWLEHVRTEWMGTVAPRGATRGHHAQSHATARR